MSSVAAIEKMSTLKDLKDAAKDLGVPGYSKYKKDDMEDLRAKVIEAFNKGKKSPRPAPVSKSPLFEVKWTEEMVLGIETLSKLKELAKSLGIRNLANFKKENMEDLRDQVVDALAEGKAPEAPKEKAASHAPTRHQVEGEESITKLKEMAKALGITGFSSYKKDTIEDLREKILEKMSNSPREVKEPAPAADRGVILLVRAEDPDGDLIMVVSPAKWEEHFAAVVDDHEKMADKINEVAEMVAEQTNGEVTFTYQKDAPREIKPEVLAGRRVFLTSNYY